MANGELVPLVNFRTPANENNRSVSFNQTFTAAPFYVDFRALVGSDMAGTPFRPFGVMIDNTANTATLEISFNDTGYRMICKAGEMLSLPYPAGPYTVAAIVGDGPATVIFVDYPVEPYSSNLTNTGGGGGGVTTWGSITGTLSSQTDLQNALNAIENKIAWGQIAGTLSDQTDLQLILTDLQNQINAIGPGPGGALPRALVYYNVAATGLTFPILPVPFPAVAYDANGMWDAATSEFVVPAGVTLARFKVGLRFRDGAGAMGMSAQVVDAAGNPVLGGSFEINRGNTGLVTSYVCVDTPIIPVTAGARFRARANNTGLTLANQLLPDQTYFSMEVMG